ncbi:uncharacterized protein IUM83_04753 [Phytophthora cinnamomi]|uniref:uncharacterized protein n=1 Tax=Phytophthora cinnamomi TaxID=4785 RepID=UPI00355957A7|nr:hypothetical protein IUM83_04753 [Phytophthora cinnamomi]
MKGKVIHIRDILNFLVHVFSSLRDNRFCWLLHKTNPNPVLESMAPSMADHLRSQEYMRQRRSTAALLVEPRLTDENASHLVEMYERKETPAVDYLSLVTSARAFTPPSTTHAVVIESGSYCSSSPAPVILKSFCMTTEMVW